MNVAGKMHNTWTDTHSFICERHLCLSEMITSHASNGGWYKLCHNSEVLNSFLGQTDNIPTAELITI